MPCAVDAIEVDESQPARPGDLEVVPIDRLAPPPLFHPPAIADLDRFPTTIPTEGEEPSARIQLDVDCGMLPQQTGHRDLRRPIASPIPSDNCRRHFHRPWASGASGSTISIQPTRCSPKRIPSRASCQPSRPVRPVCGVKRDNWHPAPVARLELELDDVTPDAGCQLPLF